MGAPKKQEPVEQVIAEFDRREPALMAFCARTRLLIEACLQDAGIRYQSIQARVKSKKKLREKYLNPDKGYQCLDDITDLAGLRVITYYDDEVDRVAAVIEKEFKIDKKESVDKRDVEPDRFGYRAINFVCGHLEKRTSDVEYKKFGGVLCEIQITSILGHAWSEIEHEWYDLRDAYPADVKRRFSMIAALFELAGREFVDIRDSRAKYERAVALQVEAKLPDIPIDAVSLRSFIEQEPVVRKIDKAVASAMDYTLVGSLTDDSVERRSKAIQTVGISTIQEIRDALVGFGDLLPEFMKRCSSEAWPNSPKGGEADSGLCIYNLALFLAAGSGADALSSFFGSIGAVVVDVELEKVVSIAKETSSKYGK